MFALIGDNVPGAGTGLDLGAVVVLLGFFALAAFLVWWTNPRKK
jgi:hypothetical protein